LKELEVLFVSKQILYKYACLNFSNFDAACKPMLSKVVKGAGGWILEPDQSTEIGASD